MRGEGRQQEPGVSITVSAVRDSRCQNQRHCTSVGANSNGGNKARSLQITVPTTITFTIIFVYINLPRSSQAFSSVSDLIADCWQIIIWPGIYFIRWFHFFRFKYLLAQRTLRLCVQYLSQFRSNANTVLSLCTLGIKVYCTYLCVRTREMAAVSRWRPFSSKQFSVAQTKRWFITVGTVYRKKIV